MNHPKNDALSQLKKAIIRQKTTHLPDPSSDPALYTLHSRIEAYDRFVTQTVSGVMGGSQEADIYPGVEELEAEIERIKNSASDSDPSSSDLYQNYKRRLDHMLALAIEVVKERS